MDFLRDQHGAKYAPNTRETFRRQVLHQFVSEGIADSNPFDPELPTNSPHAHYAVTLAALSAVRAFNSKAWEEAVGRFRQERRQHLLRRPGEDMRHRVPVQLPEGHQLLLSPGKHNEVQRAVVEEFAPRFVPGAHLLYLGDTEDKELWVDNAGLADVGIAITAHDKLPDLILHDEQRRWLVFVEAVTSHGPVTEMRLNELRNLVDDNEIGLVFVTAFPDAAEFRKHVNAIAWETEVWMADQPDHLVHYDGDRFLGPRR